MAKSKSKKKITLTAQNMFKTLMVAFLVQITNQQQFTSLTHLKSINSQVDFKWKIEGSKIRMYIEKKAGGHLWFGPGQSMSDGNCFKIEKTNSGNDLTVTYCKLVGTTSPDCSISQTSFQVVHKVATPTSLKVEILRDLNPGNGLKTIIDGENAFIWSMTSSDVAVQHQTSSDRNKLAIDLKDKTGGNIKLKVNPWGDGTFMIHQHGHLILWTLIADTLIIIGKYWKSFNRWFDVHAWSFLAVAILNLIFSYQAPDDDHRRILQEKRDLGVFIPVNSHFTERERILAQSLADGELHETFAGGCIIFTYAIVVSGLILRFVIALEKRVKWLHFVSTLDLTKQRLIHTLLGIIAWVFGRLACLTGTSLHEVDYGSTLYILLIIETIVAICLFILFEIVYRMKRVKWRVNFANEPVVKGKEYEDILMRLRNKGNFFLNI